MAFASKAITPAEINEAIAQTPPTKEGFEILLGEGRKALMVNDLEEACDKLGDSVDLAFKLFGEFAAETFTPHFYYGKALLFLALTEKDDINNSEFENDSGVQEGDAQELGENQQAGMKDDGNVVVPMEEDAEQSEVDMDQTLNHEDDDETEEDIESTQLAFEALEYARAVCERNTDNSPLWLERQKDTFILLGQVALNEDHLDGAIEDFNTALKIMDAHFPDNFRETSYVHLELGRIHCKNNEFAESSSHIQKSIEALQKLKAKTQAEPSEDLTLEKVDELLEDAFEEQKLTQLREAEYKENPEKFAPKFDDKLFKSIEVTRKEQQDSKPVETIQVKRTEKRPAGDSTDGQVDFKKSKVGGGSIDEA